MDHVFLATSVDDFPVFSEVIELIELKASPVHYNFYYRRCLSATNVNIVLLLIWTLECNRVLISTALTVDQRLIHQVIGSC